MVINGLAFGWKFVVKEFGKQKLSFAKPRVGISNLHRQ